MSIFCLRFRTHLESGVLRTGNFFEDILLLYFSKRKYNFSLSDLWCRNFVFITWNVSFHPFQTSPRQNLHNPVNRISSCSHHKLKNQLLCKCNSSQDEDSARFAQTIPFNGTVEPFNDLMNCIVVCWVPFRQWVSTYRVHLAACRLSLARRHCCLLCTGTHRIADAQRVLVSGLDPRQFGSWICWCRSAIAKAEVSVMGNWFLLDQRTFFLKWGCSFWGSYKNVFKVNFVVTTQGIS